MVFFTNEFSVNEQAALGAWFNLIGDILSSNAAWQAVLNERFEDKEKDDEDSLTVIKEALEKLKDKVEKWEKENEPNNH
ncbi:hypothetical protein [uncultured Thomasclavelia sp.]|uniref:hypothetical protein n=1 Tax=uncultured Thomasclavelia sp. TaxID=3025759 RepID=UPI002636815A|nr:hypothetical protein [uncultured Thomasclavelia sp.]